MYIVYHVYTKSYVVLLVSDNCNNYGTTTGAILTHEYLITRLPRDILCDGIHGVAQNVPHGYPVCEAKHKSACVLTP